MITTEFDYRRAASLDEAIAALQETDGKLLAGGHSIIPLMKLRLSEPGTLVDIGRIPDLKGVREREGKIGIGAGTTHHDVANSELLREKAPVVADVAGEIGDPQVRNRGTLGGSLAHADPAADYPAVMLALDAEIHIKGGNGWRSVKASDFFQDMMTVDLAEDEVIVSAQFDPIQTASYAKLHQRASHYAIVGVCAALGIENGLIQWARIGLTGATGVATRLAAVEERLTGKQPEQSTIDDAAGIAGDDIDEDDLNADIHASPAYRRAMIKVFTRRALEGAVARQVRASPRSHDARRGPVTAPPFCACGRTYSRGRRGRLRWPGTRGRCRRRSRGAGTRLPGGRGGRIRPAHRRCPACRRR
ncbi:MAG: xanthine dehydrogenase family protein subunit M [Dehalococcoidia bacterium]|nr:xanthine dehydrogenase family protein subunit M [Dehalococcoidia bacterium]